MPILPDGRSYIAYNAANDVNGNKVCKVLLSNGDIVYVRDARMPISGHAKWYSSLNALYQSKVAAPKKAQDATKEFVVDLGKLLHRCVGSVRSCEYCERPRISFASGDTGDIKGVTIVYMNGYSELVETGNRSRLELVQKVVEHLVNR